jgi:hypothetical protein
MVEGLEGGLHGGDRSHARRRLTVAQAADQLGVTVDAIPSRVKRGTIDHVREGGRVYIMLGGAQHATSRDQGTDQDTALATEVGPGHRDDLVEELHLLHQKYTSAGEYREVRSSTASENSAYLCGITYAHELR